MAAMKISVDAAMRARDVSPPPAETADAPAAGQGADPASAAGGQASRGQANRSQANRSAASSNQTGNGQTGAGQSGAGQTSAGQTGASQTAASQASADGSNGHQAGTGRASRALPATQFRPKKRSRRRGR
jgi:hypothetical protein